MRGTLLKGLVAALLLCAGFGIAPGFWRGQVYGRELQLPKLAVSNSINDPELALGALLYCAMEGRAPEPEWLATIEGSEKFRAVLADWQGLPVAVGPRGESFGVLPVAEGAPRTAFRELARIANRWRALEGEMRSMQDYDALWMRRLTQVEVASLEQDLLDLHEALALPYDDHTAVMNAALLRFLEAQGVDRDLATSVVVDAWIRRWGCTPLGRLRGWYVQHWLENAGRPLSLVEATDLRTGLESLRQRQTILFAYDPSRLEHELRETLAAGVSLALSMVIVFVFWLVTLFAWWMLRRRGAACGSPPRAGASGICWLIVPTLGALAFAYRDWPGSVPTLAIFGLGLGIALDARARGLTPSRSGWAALGWESLAIAVLTAIAAGAGTFWSELAVFRDRPMVRVSLLSAGVTMLVAVLFVWAAWGIEPLAARLRLRRLFAALTVLAMFSMPLLGGSAGATSRMVFETPAGALLWLAVFGILYWAARSILGRRFDPRHVTGYRLMLAACAGLLTMALSPRSSAFGDRTMILCIGATATICFGMVIADGGRRGVEPAVRQISAWCAAWADGLLLLAALLVAYSVYARATVTAGTDLLLQLMGLGW